MLRSPLHSSLAQAARGAEAAGRRGRKQDRQEIVRPVSDNRERERDMMRWKSGVEYVSRATGWHMIAAAAAAPITVLLFRLFPANQTRRPPPPPTTAQSLRRPRDFSSDRLPSARRPEYGLGKRGSAFVGPPAPARKFGELSGRSAGRSEGRDCVGREGAGSALGPFSAAGRRT